MSHIVPRALSVALFLVAVALVACGGDSAPATGAVGDIDEMLVSGPTVVDITARSARIVAETGLDVVCGVAYGPTTEYGGLATDTDMAGGGHSDHGPRLVGLQPDTEYHFRFGGVDADGLVYQSRDYTFRTPPAEEGAAQEARGDNLALASNGGRVAGTSSNFGGAANDAAWGGNGALDGDPATEWSSDGDGDDAWIEVGLPGRTHVTSLGFRTRTMGDSAQINSFQVVADNGAVYGPFRLDGADTVHYFAADLTTGRLRFEVVESSGGNTGAVEIEVYGDPAP